MTIIHRRIFAGHVLVAAVLLLAGRAGAQSCQDGPTTLCLDHGRVRLSVAWDGEVRPHPSAFVITDRAGSFASEEGAPSLLVHLADGRAENGHLWLQQFAPPGLAYSLVLEDLKTGEQRFYSHTSGEGEVVDRYALREAFAGGTDRSTRPLTEKTQPPARAEEMCLAEGRVGVAASSGGIALQGRAVSDDTAVFSAGGEGDPDVVVSVIDGRRIDGAWWVLSSSPTGVPSRVEISDLESQVTRAIDRVGPETLLGSLPTAATIAVVLDVARVAQAALTEQGGSIQAKSANGTVFTLTVPANALFTNETIKLTPIKSVQRLPFTPGLVGGVQIDPPGLSFAKPARLLITPAQPVAKVQETTFGYRKGGAQFFLFPARLGTPTVSLNVAHTGGFGLARATTAEQQAQLKRLSPLVEDQFEQGLWSVHSRLRQGKSLAATAAAQPLGSNAVQPLGSAAVEQFFKDTYQRSLKVMLTDVAASCAGRKKGGQLAYEFIVQGQADGFSGAGDFVALQKALNQGNAKCYDEAALACIGGDSTQAVPLIRAWRQLESEGATDLVDPSKGEKCLVFDLQLVTGMDFTTPGIGARLDAFVSTKIRFTRPFHFGHGEATLYADHAVWTGPDLVPECTTVFTGLYQKGALSVRAAVLNANYYNGEGSLPRIAVVYDLGNPQEQLNVVRCDPPPDGDPIWVQYFSSSYLWLHIGEKANVDGFNFGPYALNEYMETHWVVLMVGVLFAKKDYERTACAGPCDGHAKEVTNLTLFHRPGE